MNPDPIPIDPWLTPKEVYQIHRIHPVTLCEWRRKRIGPEFRPGLRAIRSGDVCVEVEMKALPQRTKDLMLYGTCTLRITSTPDTK